MIVSRFFAECPIVVSQHTSSVFPYFNRKTALVLSSLLGGEPASLNK
ncbi:hypothetical protein [Bacillus thuringiensis]